FFWLESSHNYGAAYGIFSGQTVLLIIVSIIMLGLIIAYNWFHKKKTILYCVSLGLICGGAIGNLIDRIFLGYVRDFIRFSFFNFNFNIADACLTIGVIMFAVYLIFYDDLFKKIKTKKQAEQADKSEEEKSAEQENPTEQAEVCEESITAENDKNIDIKQEDNNDIVSTEEGNNE
ncbi:MAG: signal peptidase II, partial [Clostridia bacterium]|nr:signal peptidase II [Clostridia bacterium]